MCRGSLPMAQDRKVFVGGIPQHLSQNDLYETFLAFAGVERAWVQKLRAGEQEAGGLPKSHRGFGFVVFCDAWAIDELLPGCDSRFIHMKDGAKVEVKRAVSGTKAKVKAEPHISLPQRDLRLLPGAQHPQLPWLEDEAPPGFWPGRSGGAIEGSGAHNYVLEMKASELRAMQHRNLVSPAVPGYGPPIGHQKDADDLFAWSLGAAERGAGDAPRWNSQPPMPTKLFASNYGSAGIQGNGNSAGIPAKILPEWLAMASPDLGANGDCAIIAGGPSPSTQRFSL